MSARKISSPFRHYGWLLLILLVAAFLRLHDITSIPSGMTHDEADHGLTAWRILDEGAREIYFTIGYGREPLYDYVTAALMSFLGPTILAGRITSAYSSLLLIAGMAAWVRRAFNRPAALLTAASLAVAFWPVMSGRQALRSVMLPALFTIAAVLFWRGLEGIAANSETTSLFKRRSSLSFLAAGLFLGLTFYTYIPARGLWLIFPLLLVYWGWANRPLLRRMWLPVGLMLLVMFLAALPLLTYLAANPAAEARIDQLAAPLTAAASGDFSALGGNIQGALRLFMIEGDPAWRYNISGRPILGPLFGLLFLIGLIVALFLLLRRKGQPAPWGNLSGAAAFLSLTWLAAGLAPALATGPELSMTQAIGMQPVLYLFPALALVSVGEIPLGGKPLGKSRWVTFGVILIFAGTAITTYRDYFQTWANNPQVRVHYESTMAAAMAYLDEHNDEATAVSSITPGRYHSPALAQMLLGRDAASLFWFDARSSLLLPPADELRVVIPGFTPISPALSGYFSTAELQETLPLRESDLDRPLRIYQVDGRRMDAAWQRQLAPLEVSFADAAKLRGFELQTKEVAPGEKVALVTYWQVERPLEGVMLFAHVLGSDGIPIAQADILGVPGESWRAGSRFLQFFEITLPPETAAGRYPLAVGMYTQDDGQRIPIEGSSQSQDIFTLTELEVKP